MTLDRVRPISRRRIWLARGIAIAVDTVQIALLPFFSEGAISPVNAGLDVIMALLMTWLIGWHIAFLPTFIIEALPFADLAPTWTLAVLFVTRKKRAVEITQ